MDICYRYLCKSVGCHFRRIFYNFHNGNTKCKIEVSITKTYFFDASKSLSQIGFVEIMLSNNLRIKLNFNQINDK
jgi:hypothetical protein